MKYLQVVLESIRYAILGAQRGFWGQSQNVYARARDGVHLSSLGQENY